MVSDAYTITDTDPIPPKMANTDLSIWYRCIPKRTIICYTSSTLKSAKIPFDLRCESVTYIYDLGLWDLKGLVRCYVCV